MSQLILNVVPHTIHFNFPKIRSVAVYSYYHFEVIDGNIIDI